jgi:hypothetical protein
MFISGRIMQFVYFQCEIVARKEDVSMEME